MAPLCPGRRAAIACLLLAAPALAAKAAGEDSPVLFATDLEDQDPDCWSSRPRSGCLGWTGIREACFSLCVGETAHTGAKALKIDFARNEDYGGSLRAEGGRHVFTRFYDYYAPRFDFGAGMKIHRLSSFNQAAQKMDYDIILQLKAEEPGSNNCGTTEAKWLDLSYNGGPVDWGSAGTRFSPRRGRWYLVETEIKLNTPGRADGEVRVRLDGRLAIERKGVNIAGNLSSPINSVLFGGWYSNSAAGRNPCPDPAQVSTRYLDDPAVSLAYVGPVPEVAEGPRPGTRKVTLSLPWPGALRAEFGPTAAYGAVSGMVESRSGLFSLVLEGLDTNRTYHYRLKGTLPGMGGDGAWVSPGYAFSTALADPRIAPARPRPEGPRQEGPLPPAEIPPSKIPAHRHDPIPD